MTQYATFRVGERLLGLDLLMVREILRPLAISPVPRSAPNIRGLLNLRDRSSRFWTWPCVWASSPPR